MADYYSGPYDALVQITSADTMYLRLYLCLDTDPTTGATGIVYNAAGMTVAYCKPGETGFTAFPSFGTANWTELGYGWYHLAIRGGTPAELALLDTAGPFLLYVKAPATKACKPCRTIISARRAQLGDNMSAVASVTGAVGSVTGLTPANLDAKVSDVKAKTDLIPASPAAVGSNMGTVTGVSGNVTGSVGSVASYGTLVADIAAAIADHSLVAYESDAESATTLGGMIALMRAMVAGKLDIDGTTLTIYEADNSTVIATYTLTPDYTGRSAPS